MEPAAIGGRGGSPTVRGIYHCAWDINARIKPKVSAEQ